VIFSFSKVVGNVLGYATGSSKAKNRGAFGYVGLLAVTGLAALVFLNRAGYAAAFTARVETAVETARPYAATAMEKAKPHVDAAIALAMPYVDAAVAAAKPHLDTAKAVVESYLGGK
jgi:hypothetical protein